jgi:hypothetical protein
MQQSAITRNCIFCGGGGDYEKFMVPSYRLVQCCGSVPLIYGSGPDPAPIPALLVSDLQGANKNLIF